MDVTGSVAVVTGEELRRTGARTLQDALQDVVGVEAAGGSDGGPRFPNLGMWGLKEFDALLVTVDGVPAGGPFNPSLAQIPIEDIDQIEIAKGPQGTLYGVSAFAGMVQVFTRRGKNTSVTLRARLLERPARLDLAGAARRGTASCASPGRCSATTASRTIRARPSTACPSASARRRARTRGSSRSASCATRRTGARRSPWKAGSSCPASRSTGTTPWAARAWTTASTPSRRRSRRNSPARCRSRTRSASPATSRSPCAPSSTA